MEEERKNAIKEKSYKRQIAIACLLEKLQQLLNSQLSDQNWHPARWKPSDQ